MFSLDKLVCKQMRDNDVKAYFEGFGPKYVEWLSDWSFNVVFQDEEEAKKAAASKSFALPEALPQDLRVKKKTEREIRLLQYLFFCSKRDFNELFFCLNFAVPGPISSLPPRVPTSLNP